MGLELGHGSVAEQEERVVPGLALAWGRVGFRVMVMVKGMVRVSVRVSVRVKVGVGLRVRVGASQYRGTRGRSGDGPYARLESSWG